MLYPTPFFITRQKPPTGHSLVSNEECPAPESTYSYQNEKRDFTKQARKVLSILLVKRYRAPLQSNSRKALVDTLCLLIERAKMRSNNLSY